jgi:hypothetical protein
VRPLAVGAALVKVADQEVGTAGVAAFADLPQQLLRWHPGFFGPAVSGVSCVRVLSEYGVADPADGLDAPLAADDASGDVGADFLRREAG